MGDIPVVLHGCELTVVDAHAPKVGEHGSSVTTREGASTRGGRVVNPLVDAVAAAPGLAARLVAAHVDDGTGHCRACPIGGQQGFTTWPCNLHNIAAAALQHRRGRS